MKQRLYIELLNRLEVAYKTGFHHEACWLAYVIICERTNSVLNNSGNTTGSDSEIAERLTLLLDGLVGVAVGYGAKVMDGPIPKELVGKTQTILKVREPKTFKQGLYEDIQNWVVDRVFLDADLRSGKVSIREVDAIISKLSKRGLNLTKRLCAVATLRGQDD